MSGPIPFLQPDDQGHFQVDKRAINILKKITTPVAVVTVAGPYRTGKSYLLNRLVYDENAGLESANKQAATGFAVGNTINSCTKGIWLWSEPYYNEANKTTYIFLDTEGLNSTGEEATFDTQIFSLSVLLSSVFILNTMNTITESALEELELVAECSKKISFQHKNQDADDEEEDNGEVDHQLALHFPRLIWVLRDFTLSLVDKNQNAITPNQYLENSLSALPQNTKKSVEEKNRIRKCIRDCFIKRDCFPLPRPVSDDDLLKNISGALMGQMKPRFEDGIRQLKQRLLQLYNHFKEQPIQPKQSSHINQHDICKYIDGKPVTGDVLAELAYIYCDAINSGEIPTILSAWQSVLENKKLQEVGSFCTTMNSYLWSLVEPTQQQQQSQGNRRGSNVNIAPNVKNAPVGEPEYDVDIIETKFHQKLQSFTKLLSNKFPGDADSLNSVIVMIEEGTLPTLEKVCNFAAMKATEYNKKLFTTIMAYIDPTYKKAYNDLLPFLCAYDYSTGEKPKNQQNAIISTLAVIVELFREKAKGKNKIEIENDIITELCQRIVTLQSATITTTGSYLIDTIGKAKILKDKLEAARNENDTLQSKLKQYVDQVSEFQLQLVKLRDEKSSIQNDLSSTKSKLEHLQSEHHNLKNSKDSLSNTIDTLKRKFDESKEAVQNHRMECASLQNELNSMKSQHTALKEQHMSQETKYKQIKLQLSSSKQSTDAQVASHQQQLNDYEQKVANLLEKMHSKDKETSKYEQQIEHYSKELKRIKEESNKLLDKNDKNEEDMAKYASKLKSYELQISKLQQESTNTNSKLQTHTDSLDTITSQRDKLQHTLEKVKNQYQNALNQNEISQNQLVDAQQRILQHEMTIQQLNNAIENSKTQYYTLQQQQQHQQQQQQQLQSPSLTTSSKRKAATQTQPNNVKKQRASFDHDDNNNNTMDYDDQSSFNTHFHYDGNDDDGDSDHELEQIARTESIRRKTIKVSSMHDNEKESKDASTGWNWSASPAKVPDQQKILDRRRRDGSIFHDTDEQAGVSSTRSKKGHGRVIEPAFKKAARKSMVADYENEFQLLKSRGITAEDLSDSDSDISEELQPVVTKSRAKVNTSSTTTKTSKKTGPIVPMDAEPVRDPSKLTISELKSWVTSLDVSLPPKISKAQLIALLYKEDPRLE